MKIFSSALCILLVLATACSDDQPVKSKSGYFKLSRIQSPNAKMSEASEAEASFNLGDLKASREFYFLLGNGGEGEIFDITLESSNPNFVVSPQEISSLPGTASEGDVLIPLVSIGVVHGVHINGFGFTDILPKGENEAVITITGKTIVDGQTITVSSDFDFTTFARVVNIELYNKNGTEIDLDAPIGSMGGSEHSGGLGGVRVYGTLTQEFKVKNTGNVTIELEGRHYIGALGFTTDYTIEPGESLLIDLYFPEQPDAGYTTLFSVDGNGTVTDNERLSMGNNGKAYLVITAFDL